MGKAAKKSGKDNRSQPQQQQNDDDGDDMETFYDERDEKLRAAISKTTKKHASNNKKSVSWALTNNSSDEENGRDEVLAFDDDSMGSDDEDDDGGNDNDYQDIADGDSDNEVDEDQDAKLEEQEAVQIQKRYYDMLEKNDFGLDLFRQKPSMPSAGTPLDDASLPRHIILPDNLLELGTNERLQLIRDQSPELEALCNEFKRVFDDLKIYLLPFVQLVIDTSSLEEFHSYPGWQFVLSLLELYLTYCSYLSLYLTMKSTDNNPLKHPIVQDIEQYRKLCQIVNDDFQSMKSDLLRLCEILQERKRKISQLSLSSQQESIARPHLVMSNGISLSKKTAVCHQGETTLEKNNHRLYFQNGTTPNGTLRERMMKKKEQRERLESEMEQKHDVDEPEKRGITYAMEKNKGLTAKRKKEYRNPRVRNRNKYARALVKRTSNMPNARNEEQKYTGEPTGIRAGIKRGIKLKS
jgi:U3 small nucleolar RNA-associated protein 3